jgi:hypothetical protein
VAAVVVATRFDLGVPLLQAASFTDLLQKLSRRADLASLLIDNSEVEC